MSASIHPSPLDMRSVERALTELLVLEEAIKPMQKRINEIREWCKSQGSFATDNFVVSVKPRNQVRLVGLKAAIEALGIEILESNGLIQEIEVFLVNVSKKGLS
jgi:hypothetical protein